MTSARIPERLGLFTRLVRSPADEDAATVFRHALEQIAAAERLGFETAWVAQHHLEPDEGGLPSPLVFLAHVAARFPRLRLGTAIVTLALEDPIRVAEDASVLDTLAGGRLELGFGAGGSGHAFDLFGVPGPQRQRVYAEKLDRLRAALSGAPLLGDRRLNPPGGTLPRRLWQATFSVSGAERAGAAGDGLLLSKSQPRAADSPGATLRQLQEPMVDAYLAALPAGAVPRIGASRGVFVADDRASARTLAERGAARHLAWQRRNGGGPERADTVAEVLRDCWVGTPDDVAEQLAADTVLSRATELMIQVHPVDPGHAETLRSIELFATEVVPRLGGRAPASQARR
ncbi:putative FMN-dependent luciferase-like monooxygenase [Nocardia aurantia]|uniref:F420-dependent glucose-6-phosphate dehydrogenase n=1 Tax=Nocardia aurantia TaxID=2585199 RepID=A0A7K0DX16_9NOCA|nr:putative FMN-dependent luciferase-like monooxygenase [Nocardia aurantia]MQY30077.1 F420-dependent glucose-6-phosphate dehydrogenase [Nocardia aurantia]